MPSSMGISPSTRPLRRVRRCSGASRELVIGPPQMTNSSRLGFDSNPYRSSSVIVSPLNASSFSFIGSLSFLDGRTTQRGQFAFRLGRGVGIGILACHLVEGLGGGCAVSLLLEGLRFQVERVGGAGVLRILAGEVVECLNGALEVIRTQQQLADVELRH